MRPVMNQVNWVSVGEHMKTVVRNYFSEPTAFNGPDTRPMPSVGEQEDLRERDWHDLETAAREFIKTYGVSAMLRCVSRAIEGE